MGNEELIYQFVGLHSQAKTLLEENKIVEAKQKYLEVLESYHTIQKSELEKFHKDLAYDQVTTLFSEVNAAKHRVKVPYNMIAAAFVIVAVSILVVMKPSIVGLAGLDDIARQTIGKTFTNSGLYQATLKEKPLSLMLSGVYNGSAKVYYKQGSKLELIVDTNKIEGSSFTDVCEETCTVSADSNTVDLFVNVESGSITLGEISYKMARNKNTAPTWTGSKTTFKAKINKATTIDLNDYFKDAEGDEITYLATTTQGLTVNVQDSRVTITPSSTGEKRIIFVASDLRDVTRVSVKIVVA